MRRTPESPHVAAGRVRALVLVLAALGLAASAAAASAQPDTTVLVLRSEPGEHLLDGGSRDIGPSSGTFYAFLQGTNDKQLTFGYQGHVFSDHWDFDVALHPGPVVAGTYVVPLSEYPFLFDDESGMYVSGPASRSGAGTALVHIKQLVAGDAKDGLATLWARFEFHHAGNTPALSGEFRRGLAPPIAVIAPLRRVVEVGESFAIPVNATSATGRPVELTVIDPPHGSGFAPAGSGANLIWTPNIEQQGLHVIRFAAADDSGRVDTTWTVVHVRGERRLRIDSPEGEWIGGGATREYDAGGARFTARPTFVQNGPHQGVHVEVESLGGDPSFTIEFFAPAGESLRVGRYPIATNEFPQPPGTARMQVNSSGRGCSRYAGSFTIHELDRGIFGVERVRATFDQRCDDGPALFGEVRVDARAYVTWTAPFVVPGRHGEPFGFVAEAFDRRGGPLALTAASLPDGAKFIDQGFGQGTFAWTPPLGAIGRHEVLLVAAGAGGATDTARVRLQIAGDRAFAYVSPAGDGIGGGVSRSYGFDDGDYAATHDEVFGLTARFKPDSVDTPWTIQVDAPGGLAPGFYTGAVEFGSGVPRLRILAPTMAGGCNDEPGRFEIKQLEMEPNGDVRALWMRFARRCDPTAPMFAGDLRIDAFVQVYTLAPALVTQEIGSTMFVNVEGWNRDGAPAALHVTGLPEGATFQSPDPGYGQIAWTPREDQIGSHLVVLHAVGEGGVADSTMMELEVVGRTRWSYLSEAPEEPVGQGGTASYGPGEAAFFPYHSFGSVSLSAYTGAEPPGGTVTLLPPAGTTFAPGIYPAARFPVTGLPHAGLQVTIGDRSCSDVVDGAIRIRSVRVVDDVVQELDADYQQTCGASPYALRGAILYRVPTTFRAEAPIAFVVEAGDSVQAGVTASGGPGPLSFEVLDLPPGAEFGPAGPDGAQLRWETGASSMGVHVVRFVAIAADGRRDTVDTRIRVLGETRLTVVSAPGDPVGDGQTYEHRWRTARWDLQADFEGGLYGLVTPRQFSPAWSVVFAPPFGGFLTPGVYENAVHPQFRFTKPLHPVLHVSRDGSPPCLELTGRFEVKHLAFANHQVDALWIRFEQRCHPDSAPLTGEIRYNLDRSVPALASPVSSSATDRGAIVVWQIGGAASEVAIERRAEKEAAWRELARAAPDGARRVVFEDPAVEPGVRYGYRLALAAAGGVVHAGETWVDIPTRAAFALDGARPNPTSSGVVATFAIPGAGPVRLELLDVGGRRVAVRDEPSLAAGRHALPLAAAGTLAPGVYVIRLGWDGRTAHRRVTVVE